MFNRKIRYTIPTLDDKIDNELHKNLDMNDESGKSKQRYYSNRHCKNRTFDIGDKVLVLQKKVNKLSPKFNQYPYVITGIKGTMIIARNPINNHQITRNISHFIKIPIDAKPPQPVKETFDEEEDDSVSHKVDRKSPKTTSTRNNNNETNIEGQQTKQTLNAPFRKQYPKRTRRPVDEWRKY